jgi:hypothetical protein
VFCERMAKASPRLLLRTHLCREVERDLFLLKNFSFLSTKYGGLLEFVFRLGCRRIQTRPCPFSFSRPNFLPFSFPPPPFPFSPFTSHSVHSRLFLACEVPESVFSSLSCSDPTGQVLDGVTPRTTQMATQLPSKHNSGLGNLKTR